MVGYRLLAQRGQAEAGGDDFEEGRLAAAVVTNEKADRCAEGQFIECPEERQKEGVAVTRFEQFQGSQQRHDSEPTTAATRA
jgi:hypothetical protein